MAGVAPRAHNNLLHYYGPLAGIGGINTLDAAVEIVSQFSFVVISPHVGTDLNPNLYRILDQARKDNPSIQVFGYTSLGTAASYAAWKTTMQQWATDLPSPYTANGIFIDTFGQDYGNSTRANQNQAIADTHTAGYSAYVNAFDPVTLFGTLPGEAAPQFGTHATIVDYFLMESYYQSNLAPTLEEPDKRLMRAAVGQWALSAGSGLKAVPMVMLGSGGGSDVPYSTWDFVRNEIAAYGMSNLGVGPSDYGATSHLYFWNHLSNNVPSG